MPQVRLATFNVNSVRSRLHVLEPWLHDSGIEVLCLQETKVEDKDFPVDFFRTLGYEVAFRGQKSYNGVAVASRFPIESAQFGFGDGEEPDDASRIARVRVAGLSIVNSYVPQGKSIDHADYLYKQRFLARMRLLFEREHAKEDLLLWTGDLNVVAADIDVTNPGNKRDHVCVHETIRAAYQHVLSWGLVDLFRQHKPEAGEYSFWDYRVKDAFTRNIGWRIDHLLGTPALSNCCADAWVERPLRAMEKPSDHTAVVGLFELPSFPSM